MELQQVYAFKSFDSTAKVWIEFVRSTFHAPFWKCEARYQDGRILHSRLVTPEHMQSLWTRYGSTSEITPFS